MLKKTFLSVAFATLVAAFLVISASSSAQATNGALNVTVGCLPEKILPGQTVTITCTSNMNGEGVVFVIQPSQGSSATSASTLYVQGDLNRISSDPVVSLHKVMSYAWVKITGSAGGQQKLTFPKDFTGLNGIPNTQTMGKYYVFFVFLHMCVCKFDFNCSGFFVVPEVPLGTLVATSASFTALIGFMAVRRPRTKRRFS
jgi:hypothetical protein